MRHIMQLIVISAILLSCTDNSTKEKELQLKERELNLKERELNAVDSQRKQSSPQVSKPSLPQTPSPSQTQEVTQQPSINGDREKFIGSFYWSGGCPRGCDYTYVFKPNGKVTTQGESTRPELNGTETSNWSINEKAKTFMIGKAKYSYKFKGQNIIVTDYENPSEVQEWVRQN